MALRTVTLTLNGTSQALSVNKQATLLNVLRNDFQFNNPKYGCGLGECGTCTVLVDGVPPAHALYLQAAQMGAVSLRLKVWALLRICTPYNRLH